ncbi:MAG: hypothetical protein INF44_07910 [Thalassospira sp.]|nr:hypothetical protein [Thalassospira sp.]
MTKDDINRMAREAGFVLYDMHNVDGQDLGESVEANDFKALERFSERLIRALMPDDWFPDSKDWQYSVWERAEIMKSKIESHREEIERLENWLEAKQGQSGIEAANFPWKGMGWIYRCPIDEQEAWNKIKDNRISEQSGTGSA